MIDGEKVTNRDLGNNFFVEISGVGASRAEETQRFLQELNSFVAVNKGIEQVCHESSQFRCIFFIAIKLFICCNVPCFISRAPLCVYSF